MVISGLSCYFGPRLPFPRSSFLVSVSRYPFSVSRFSFPVSRFPFPVSRSPFPVPRSSFPVPRSSFSVPHSPFLILRSSFSVPRSPFLVLRSSFSVLRSSFSVPHSPLPALSLPFLVPRSSIFVARTLFFVEVTSHYWRYNSGQFKQRFPKYHSAVRVLIGKRIFEFSDLPSIEKSFRLVHTRRSLLASCRESSQKLGYSRRKKKIKVTNPSADLRQIIPRLFGY